MLELSKVKIIGSGLGNGLQLGVCYFALQILQALDKFNR